MGHSFPSQTHFGHSKLAFYFPCVLIIIKRGSIMSIKQVEKLEENSTAADRFASKARLNLNDLLRRRSEQQKLDKKTNLIIVASAMVVGAVVLLILNL